MSPATSQRPLEPSEGGDHDKDDEADDAGGIPSMWGRVSMPIRKDFLPFGAPWLGEEEIAEVVDTLRSGWLSTGKKCFQLEREFAEYIGCPHAVAVNSCTAGLHLSLIVSGIGSGDEVVTTPMTFAATANVVFHVGATPVFVDIDRETLNIDPAQIGARVTERTRAVIPVHFGGLPCDMDRIMTVATQHGLKVIEDAAHAVGGRYQGRKIGSLGQLTSFSFYANKNMTTAEGGMVTTADDELAEQLRIWRLHGLSSDAWKRFSSHELVTPSVVQPGFKYNMADLQASLGIWQLRKVERFLQMREVLASVYDEAFKDVDEITVQARPIDIDQNRHGLHLYVVLLDLAKLTVTRDEFVSALRAENIGAGIHYVALHLHPYYQARLGYPRGSFPNAEYVSERVLSLPLSPSMTVQDATDVVEATKRTLQQYRRRRHG